MTYNDFQTPDPRMKNYEYFYETSSSISISPGTKSTLPCKEEDETELTPRIMDVSLSDFVKPSNQQLSIADIKEKSIRC